MDAGTLLTLDIEKPALVAACSRATKAASSWLPAPSRRTRRGADRARRQGRSVCRDRRCAEASPERRVPESDPKCGWDVLSHIDYAAQLRIKTDIVRDAFSRIGRAAADGHASDRASSPHGYRLRARFHVDGSRIGFYREGTHQICDAPPHDSCPRAPSSGLSRRRSTCAMRDSAVWRRWSSRRTCQGPSGRATSSCTVAPMPVGLGRWPTD
jgi:hypothetical protein